MRDIRSARDAGDKRIVHRHRVGRKISEPHEIAVAEPIEGQDAVGIARRHHPPSLEIRAGANLVAGPACRVGRTAGVDDPQLERPSARAGDAKREPLIEFGLMVALDLEVEAVAV